MRFFTTRADSRGRVRESERKGGRDWESESGRAREIEREDTRADDERARASATDILILFTHTHTRRGGKERTERRIHVHLYALASRTTRITSKRRTQIWRWWKEERDTLARCRQHERKRVAMNVRSTARIITRVIRMTSYPINLIVIYKERRSMYLLK